MKITKDHYDYMKQEISKVWTPQKHESHRTFIEFEGRAKDIEKRLRWDWSYYAGLSAWIVGNVYTYADDNHLDTALKAIIRDLEAQSRPVSA